MARWRLHQGAARHHAVNPATIWRKIAETPYDVLAAGVPHTFL